jgi:hypothetical protein
LSLVCLRGNDVSLTLAWNPSASPNVTAYQVWHSVGTASFTTTDTDKTNGLTMIVAADNANTTRFYVIALNNQGVPAPPSNTVTNFPAPIPVLGLSFEAEAGTVTAPFYVSNGLVQQDSQTGATNGGRAFYQFATTNAGSYSVSAMLNAPDEGANSFYVGIDSDPSEDLVWDVPITTGLQTRTVRYRADTADHQYALNAGSHALIIRGREAGAQLDRITIWRVSTPVPVPPAAPTNLRAVQVTGRRYDLQWLSDLSASTEIEQSIKAQPFVNIGTVPPGTLHLTVQLDKRREYTFRVRSKSASGTSPYSNPVIVTP